jgi:putative phosphoesterase
MKIALISDIHGNEDALDSVISDIKKCGVDFTICLGDIVTLGPSPVEVLKKIKNLKCPCIIGNHEDVLFDPNNAELYEIQKNLDSTISWCLNKLSKEDLDFLKTCQPTSIIELGNEKKMLCYHASPKSTIQGIYSHTNNEVLSDLFGMLDKNIILAAGGHTHEQMLRQYNNITIINPGSVGCAFVTPLKSKSPPSYLPIAEYAIIKIDEENVGVEFKRLKFDMNNFMSTTLKSDIPLKDWWQSQFTELGY